MPKDEEPHWTQVPAPGVPAPKRAPRAAAPPPEPRLVVRPVRRARSAVELDRRNRNATAIVGSVLFHILVLWAAGTMVPGVRLLPMPDETPMQITLVEPPPEPVVVEPPVLRKLDEQPKPERLIPPSKVQPIVKPLETQQPDIPKELLRPTPLKQPEKLVATPAPPKPTPAPPAPPVEKPAPPRPLPKLQTAPTNAPQTFEDLNLHKTPAPTPSLAPKLTLPGPPDLGGPAAPSSAAPGGGPAGGGAPAAPGAAAGPGSKDYFVFGSGKGMDCSKAAMAVMTPADQEKCKVMAALAAAAALKNMKANDRNASPLDSLGDKRLGFDAERTARAAREARGAQALAEVGSRNIAGTSGVSASAGAKCGLKFGPVADNEKLKCGVGFNDTTPGPPRP